MQIKNLETLEFYYQAFKNISDIDISTQDKNKLFDSETESLFDDILVIDTFNTITLHDLCINNESILENLANKYQDAGKISVADLIHSVQNFIMYNEACLTDTNNSHKRLLDYVYTIV